jgi:hypothetical protein
MQKRCKELHLYDPTLRRLNNMILRVSGLSPEELLSLAQELLPAFHVFVERNLTTDDCDDYEAFTQMIGERGLLDDAQEEAGAALKAGRMFLAWAWFQNNTASVRLDSIEANEGLTPAESVICGISCAIAAGRAFDHGRNLLELARVANEVTGAAVHRLTSRRGR